MHVTHGRIQCIQAIMLDMSTHACMQDEIDFEEFKAMLVPKKELAIEPEKIVTVKEQRCGVHALSRARTALKYNAASSAALRCAAL